MKLPVVPFVLDVRLQDLVKAIRGELVTFVIVWKRHSNVIHGNSYEGIAGSGLSSHPDVVGLQLDEVNNHIESWKAKVGVETGDVLGKGAFGLVVGEDVRWVVNEPERHVEKISSLVGILKS